MHRSASPVPGVWERSTRWRGWTLVRQALPRRCRHPRAWRWRSSGRGWRPRWRERSWPASSSCSGSRSSSGLSARWRAAPARPSSAWRRQQTPRIRATRRARNPRSSPAWRRSRPAHRFRRIIPLPSLAPNEQPPDPPNAPSLSLNGVGAHSISIRWTPGSGGGPVQKWEIWRRTGSGATWIKLGELPTSAQTLTNSGLASGTSYSFRVRAVNVAWLSSFSNIITATTTVPPPSLDACADSHATPTPRPTDATACRRALTVRQRQRRLADLARSRCTSLGRRRAPVACDCAQITTVDDGDPGR